MQDIKKRLPIGITSFEEMISDNYIYVDKTDLLGKLVQEKGPFFLSRPRRFGKSTLVSTLRAVFEKGKCFFKGLKIYENFPFTDTYPVLYLDFSQVKRDESDGESVSSFYIKKIKDFFNVQGVVLDGEYLSLAATLDAGLSKVTKPIVLLIDEYDAPLTEVLDNKELYENKRIMLNNFYAVVKSYSSKFKFIFITGVSRFSNLSIFSAFNNLRDISLSSEFSALVGYTQQEIEDSFKYYIMKASDILSADGKELISYDKIIDDLKLHYDGYCFDLVNARHVYNPWSIINFLSRPQDGYKGYWFETGGAIPSLLMNFIKKNKDMMAGSFIPNLFDVDRVFIKSLSSLSIDLDGRDITQDFLFTILYQAGYFSIKSAQCDALELIVPNLEVKRAIASLTVRTHCGSDEEARIIISLRSRTVKALDSNNTKELEDIFLSIINEFSYDSVGVFNESAFRDLLKLVFLLFGLHAESEVCGANGRADLTVHTDSTVHVMEFKLARSKDQLDKKHAEAISQIQDKLYNKKMTHKNIAAYSVIVAYKLADDNNKSYISIRKVNA